MNGLKKYTRKVEGEGDVTFISTKGTVVEVADYNEKSIRFVAETEGPMGTIAGFRATSIEEPIAVGDELTFSCREGMLNGSDTEDGEPANFLWSTSRSSSDDISDDMLKAIASL